MINPKEVKRLCHQLINCIDDSTYLVVDQAVEELETEMHRGDPPEKRYMIGVNTRSQAISQLDNSAWDSGPKESPYDKVG